MRTEVKIALGFFAAGLTLKQFLLLPMFISGLLFGLSVVFLVIGLLPEKIYQKVKDNQLQKLLFLKRILGINR